jgi:membrane fusion protein (multidrug efflux system)
MMKNSGFRGVGRCVWVSTLVWCAQAWGQGAPVVPRVAAPEERILVQAWAETETVVASPIVGTIVQIPSRVGTRFAKGDVLVRFECTENEAKAQIAQAELTAANESLEAKIRLKGMDAASEIEVTTAAAQVAKAKAQLDLSQYQASQCHVLAPFAGYVVRVMGKQHQTLTVGQPLLEIITAGTPKLRLSASSKMYTRLRVGTPLKVTIDELGATFDATITSVNARVDPVNQTFEMEARMPWASVDLLSGMSGTAVIAPVRSGAPVTNANKPAPVQAPASAPAARVQ